MRFDDRRIMDDPCIQARVGIETARAHAAELYYGYSRSKLKGLGLEYVDFREYSFGDDVRRIDWRLSARSPGELGYKLYVKEYEEEHIHDVTIAVSLSRSTFYKRKPMALTYTTSIVSLMASRLGDRVTLALMGGGVEYRRARNPDSIPYIIRRTICTGPRGDLVDEILQVAVNMRRGLLVYVVDYDIDPGIVRESLRILKAKGVRTLNTVVYERFEVEPPGNGVAGFTHPGGYRVHGSISDVYREIRGHVVRVKASLRTHGVTLYINPGDLESVKPRLVRGFLAARVL
ncbi:MAG: DUF58 domain-containing protein [Desulfurococcales archaeon]|nr:DUF58 domain-containing protein [Desulfurococcales archaeon]